MIIESENFTVFILCTASHFPQMNLNFFSKMSSYSKSRLDKFEISLYRRFYLKNKTIKTKWNKMEKDDAGKKEKVREKSLF